MKTVLLVIGLVAVLLLKDASAADLVCDRWPSFGPDLALGRISDEKPKTNFVGEKAYVVPDDLVLVNFRQNGNACATFVAPSGRTHTGWIPEAAIIAVPVERVLSKSWIGHWARSGPDGAEVEVTLAPENKLSVAGQAIWGAFDPERVRNGAVHVGDIAGIAAVSKNELSFAMGNDGESLPVDKADEHACRVWMRRIGPWLVVEDNYKCGGANVTFLGVYVRRRGR